MAKLPIDAELALHKFSVRYRAGLARFSSANALQKFLAVVREQISQQMQTSHGQGIGLPGIANWHQIEAPDEGR